MAGRTAAPVRTKIEALERAREKALALGLKRGETLTSKPMAELVGRNWAALRDWCDDCPELERKGAMVRGGNGVDYRFKPVQAIDLLLKHFRGQQERQTEKARRARSVVGADRVLDVPEDFSLDETAKMLRLSIEFQNARVRAGELVERSEVVEVLNRTFPDLLQAGLLAAQQADPNGRWSPEQRQAAETVARMILAAQEKVIQRDMGRISGGTA